MSHKTTPFQIKDKFCRGKEDKNKTQISCFNLCLYDVYIFINRKKTRIKT